MRISSPTRSTHRFARPLVLAVSTMALLWSPAPVAAQISRVGATVPVYSAQTSGTYVAHDPVNDLYLIVQGLGPVYGTFVDASGQPVTSTFTIHSFDGGVYGILPAVAYSPDVSNGAGGHGGFLVTWHHGANAPTSIYGAIVAYEAPGRIAKSKFVISDPADGWGSSWLCWPVVAYSKTSQRFLVVWNGRDFSIKGRFVGTDGTPTGDVIPIEGGGGSRDPSVAWNSATNEFGVGYSMFGATSAWAAFKLVRVDGSVSGRTSFGYTAGTYATSMDVNSANNYVMAWGLQPGTMTVVFDQAGAQVSPESLATKRLGGDQTLGLAFNSKTGTFLAVSSDFYSYEVGALELDANGAPLGGILTATDGGFTSSGSYYPKTAARANSNHWNIVYSRNFRESANQIIASGSVGGPVCSVNATATVAGAAAVGDVVPFAATATATGCGAATPTFSWTFGDSSPADARQNPTHAYASPGTFGWTLTVQAGTATAVKTGSINILQPGACLPATSTVVAKPATSGLTAMWQATGITVTAGQSAIISVGSTQTWVSGAQSFTAAGNPSDIVSGSNVPMPGAPRMALVGRIGTAGTPFMIGTSTQVTASATGQLYLAPNDDWYLAWDNSGSLSVSVCSGGAPPPPPPPACSVDVTTTVPTSGSTGSPVAFAATGTPSGCGSATPTYSWNFGDGSAASPQQNPTHTYSAAGTFTWTLTVQASTATATRTGSITIGAPGACLPATAVVQAQPTPVGLAAMWQGTGVTVAAGQLLTVSVDGTQTWTNAGQPFTAAGNPSDITSGTNVPMAGAPRMALVGRIGTTGVPFLIGTFAQFTAPASGLLYLAPNDDWYVTWDNSGSLSVSACTGGTACTVNATATVPPIASTGGPVAFAATCSPSGCGSAVPTYSWVFGDGTPGSSEQNPIHTYSTAGTYTWTLTVVVATATATRTGTITVSDGAACTPTTSVVLAQTTTQGLPAMWQGTGATVTAGDLVTLSVNGTQTWVSGGQNYTAAGNSNDLTVGSNSPMPGAPRMALVGRIGTTGTPFLIGTSMQFTAQATGQLFLAPNDDWYVTWDNSGSLSVSICSGRVVCSVSATATVPTTATVAAPVAFAATCSPTGCGTATPTYSWNFGDGSALSSAQNPSHIYAAGGSYTWTLTVVVDTATTTKTGTITVSTAPSCTTLSSVVLAQPSPQTLPAMWQGTGVPIASGDAVTITVSGGQTWTRGGQAWTAAGNAADLTFGYNSPMPGAPRMALVGRIGPTGPSFLVGTSLQFTAQTTGQLFLAPNDDWYMLWNNAGSLTVAICR
jgi:PKD repeat protein